MDVLQHVRDITARLAARHGLSAIAPRLVEATRVSFAMKLQPGVAGGPVALALGGTRLGGLPDLAEGSEWPCIEDAYCQFVGQVDLADLPPMPGVPRRGLVSFFHGMVEPASQPEHRVLFAAEGATLTRRRPPVGAARDEQCPAIYGGARVSLLPLPSLPPDLDDDLGADRQRLDDIEDELHRMRAGSGGRLFGHTAGWSGDLRRQAYLVTAGRADLIFRTDPASAEDDRASQEAAHWDIFLRVDSADELEMTWWDAGYLTWLTDGRDLARGDFARAYACVESS